MRLSLFILVACAVGCVSGVGRDVHADSEPGTLRDRYLERYNESVESRDDSQEDPELRRLAATYWRVAVEDARERAEVRFAVEDESGRPIDGVNVEFRVLTRGSILATEPRLTRERREDVSGNIHKKWPRGSYAIEVDVSREGYRPVSFALRERNAGSDSFHYRQIQEMLFRGFVLTPRADGGPLRVVLPPALHWKPSRPGVPPKEFFSTPPRSVWPKEPLKLDPNPVVTSEVPRQVAVTKRGTYVLLDKDGKVLWMQHLDRGNRIGIAKGWTRAEGDFYTSLYGSSGSKLKDGQSPYQWQLYSEPAPTLEGMEWNSVGS